MKKKVGKYCGLFLLLMLVFNIDLYLICLIDSSKVKENVEKSYKILNNEGYRYKVSRVFDVKNDNYTDALIINEIYSVDNKQPYISYMKARRNYQKNHSFFELLEKSGEGFTVNYDKTRNQEIISSESIGELGDFLDGKLHYSVNYGRYWHGYLIIFRPLLVFFNILQLRHVIFILFLLFFIYFIYLIYEKFDKNVSLIFALSLICSGYFSASYSLSSIPVFLLMIISSIIILYRIDKIKDFGIYMFVIGCITSFIDYLTVPIITLGFPLMIYILKLLNDNKNWKYCTKFLIINSFIWLIGYTFTWVFKWILYDLTINDSNNMISIGLSQIFLRTSRVNQIMGVETTCFPIVSKIILKSLIYIALSTLIILAFNKFNISLRIKNRNIIPFLILALYPIAWYVILANHTILHDFFTYRNSLLFMLGILLSIYELFLVKGDINEKIY